MQTPPAYERDPFATSLETRVLRSGEEKGRPFAILEDDKRKFAGKKDVPDYQFILTNKRKADEFRDRFGL